MHARVVPKCLFWHAPGVSAAPPRVIALLRFSAAGDVILCAPVIEAIARAWPESRRLFVTQARYAPLVQHHPDLHEVVARAPRESLGETVRRLRERGVDAVVDLHHSWRSIALTARLRPRQVSRWHKRSLWERLALAIAHAPYRPKIPMELRYHAAAEALVGCALPRPQLRFTISEAGAQHARALLHHAAPSISRPRVGLLPGAAWATKRWPPERFVELARALWRAGYAPMAVGSTMEREATEALVRAVPEVIDPGPIVPWHTLAAVLQACDVVVVGDTGPMHLARAVGTPAVILFGSTPASQFMLEGHQPLQRALHCQPCSFYGRAECPRGHLACLRDIEVEQVMQAVHRALAQPPSR